MKINLTGQERLQFQYILPVQGSLKTLESVENIFNLIDIHGAINETGELNFEFSEDQIIFIKNSIDFLDKTKKLSLSSLSLIHKILNIKEGK